MQKSRRGTNNNSRRETNNDNKNNSSSSKGKDYDEIRNPENNSNSYPVFEMRRSAPKLLSDEQMAEFITRGYLVFNLQSDLPTEFHHQLYAQAEELGISRSNPIGNNILPVLLSSFLLGFLFNNSNVFGTFTKKLSWSMSSGVRVLFGPDVTHLKSLK